MTRRGLVPLTAFTLLAVALLAGLGFWQLNRLEWKEGLIARIEARTKAKPISLDKAVTLAKEGRNVSYYRVEVEGRYHHERELYLYSISDGQPGWHVITPLETVDGDVVLVDRGFVPDEFKDPSARKAGQLEEVVTVIGLARPSEAETLFAPDNEPEANRWFWRDLSAMARSMFPKRIVGQLAPFFLELEANDVPGGWPKGGQTRLEITNNHLQYAVTWFGLAAALVVIYLIFVRGVYRDTRGAQVPPVAGDPSQR